MGLDEVASDPAGNYLRAAYTAYATLAVGDSTVLAAYAKGQDGLDLYRVQGSAPWISYTVTIVVGPGWDELNSFTFLTMAHLMLYRRDHGQFAFYPLDGGLNSNSKYLFHRNHAPAVSKCFTTVQPFAQARGIVVMGYAFATGAVCMYTLSGVASTPKGAAPLFANPVWDHSWAKGWTRFAFFSLGGEVLFLKSNTKYPNVNIDHVLDNPTDGTAEVATEMDLTDAQDLTVVQPFALDNGHPYFVAYRPDGLSVRYRIHSDCRGCTSVGTATAPANASAIVPLGAIGGRQFLLYVS